MLAFEIILLLLLWRIAKKETVVGLVMMFYLLNLFHYGWKNDMNAITALAVTYNVTQSASN